MRDPLDALDIFGLVRTLPDRPETIAMLLDPAHRDGRLVAVDGSSTVEEVMATLELVCDVYGVGWCLGAVVLATVRPGRPLGPNEDDHLAFAELRAIAEDRGIELLDWFVLSDRVSWSLAELTDAVPLWRGGR